jgi:hypothetical protein
MDTDMIGIDSAEEMRKKIQAKIKEEKEKNIKNVINIRIKTIDEKNCQTVLLGLFDKYDNHFDTLNAYEQKYYQNVFGDIGNLAQEVFEAYYMKKTKEEIIKDFFDDEYNGVSSIDDKDTQERVEYCCNFNNESLAPALVKYMTDILNKTDV